MFFHSKKRKGFTLIELMVSVSIFAMMTALLVTKYGNFNQSVLLTNLAYDIALTIRTAQTYGLSVQGNKVTGSPITFQNAYGVYFTTDSGQDQKVIFFADRNNDGKYSSDESISTYYIKRGAKISNICADTQCGALYASVTFLRPSPDAKICILTSCDLPYLKIVVQATDGGTRNIIIRKTGQVSVEE